MTGNITYFATAGADKVIATRAAVLHRIIIGKDVASSVLEVSDDPADGDANVKILIESGTMLADTGGVIEVNAVFPKGISADLTNQTHVTFIWSPTR